jgi:alkylation response protein AidB-like acyl-CoA dehydrogenase
VKLDLSPDQELVRDTTRRFLASQTPLTTVRALADDPRGYDPAWWRQGAELGWTAMLVPEEYGGGSLTGQGLLELAMISEEMGRLVSPGPLAPTNVVAAALAADGSEKQRADVLPAIVAGELVAAWCVAEPGGAWGPAGVTLEARPSGGGFVLTGTKSPVEAGAQADRLLVTARTADGLVQLLVPPDSPGLSITPLRSLDFTRRFAKVTFSDVEVGADAVVGDPGQAAAAAERQLQIALVLQCAETAGILDRVFAFTVEYAFDRSSFGRPLASYQALKHRFADMKMWLEACHATAQGAAEAVEAGSGSAAELVSVAKAYIGDHATEILQDCVQMHGGIGVTWDHDIHLYLRRATVNRALYGTPDQHRERLAALLGI